MSEYIDREAAKRAAHMAFVRRDDALQYSEMIHQLAKIPAADVRPVEWIPVTERLPELGRTVLAIDADGEYLTPRLEKLWDGEVWVGTRSVYDEQVPVTHWMPLPEPPKEET